MWRRGLGYVGVSVVPRIVWVEGVRWRKGKVYGMRCGFVWVRMCKDVWMWMCSRLGKVEVCLCVCGQCIVVDDRCNVIFWKIEAMWIRWM